MAAEIFGKSEFMSPTHSEAEQTEPWLFGIGVRLITGPSKEIGAAGAQKT